MIATQVRHCYFCGRSEREVEWLVVGPARGGICERCVANASAIIAGKRRDRALEREAARCRPARFRLTGGMLS